MSFYLDLDDGSEPESGRVLEHAWSGLWSAARIWDLLGSDKGERLQDMMDDEIAVPEGESMSWLAQSQIARLIALLDGLEDEAEGKLVDGSWRVLPEQVERVEREVPGLAYRSQDENGPYVSLSLAISKATSTRAFLEKARRIGCQVTFG